MKKGVKTLSYATVGFMGRGRNPAETLALTFVKLRGANPENADELRAAVGEATNDLEDAVLAERPHFSRVEAATLLDVSPPTVNKWISQELLPLQEVPGFKRPRVPAAPLLKLASEVQALRALGRKRGLLEEALSRLEQEDPNWRSEFEELYGPRLSKPVDKSEFVTAAPGADWDPDD